MPEQIVLVNDAGISVGAAPKLASHHSHTPLHLGFSCYVFNQKGQFLLTRRALSKKVWPGVWTNSVCGHPAPSESFEAAIARRLNYELGIKNIQKLRLVLPDYRYKTPPYKNIVENEICPVYVALTNESPRVNRIEVEAFKWVVWSDILDDVKKHPTKYSFWFKDQLPRLQKSPLFNEYQVS